MAKQVTVTVYQFDELSDKAKEKARDWWREATTVEDWSDNVTEDATESAGIKVKSWNIDRGSSCEIEFINSAMDSAEEILKNHGDQCDTYKVAKAFKDAAEEIGRRLNVGEIEEDECEDLQNDAIAEYKKELSKCYLEMLRKEYEHYMDDEQIDEAIRSNEYDFTEEGKRTTIAEKK